MSRQPEYLNQAEVWADGRRIIGQLLDEYCLRYPGQTVPPPALAIRDIIPEVLEARLRYDPLPAHIYAQTRRQDGRYCVTVNALIRLMPGVQDVEGVENVCLCHEAIHIILDYDLLSQGSTLPFEGMDPAPTITCYRSAAGIQTDLNRSRREFRAEEAGRAAAVSIPHLLREQSFIDLVDLGRHGRPTGGRGWSLLYEAGVAIGVNRSAIVKQLQLEGWIAVRAVSGSKQLLVQPALITLAESGP